MSIQEKMTTILKASETIQNENNVAVLGPSGTGKTVFITLLSHAIDNHFLDEHPELRAHPKDGRPFLESCENGLRKGEFPERTQQLSRDKIVFEMRGTGATASSMEFKLPDISGEDYKNMCLGEDIRGNERVVKVCQIGIVKGQPYSDMIYAVYAKMYVFLLDCSKMKTEWENDQTQYSQALTTIQDFKKSTNTSTNGRINTPIAIILTKADCLEDRDVSAKDLVKKYMRRFYNTLDDIHDGEKEYFMVHVDVQRNRENEVDSTEGLKVAKPLSYSHPAYTKFLWWLHENLLG